MRINIPPSAWLTTRYCLAVTESSVFLVSWKKGKLTLIREFVNDNQGLQDAATFFKANLAKFANKSINICVSVIGEDYRFEKVAHLIGKYRTDMLKRRFQQLFRGASYHTALYQGRESIGRRQDFYLFCGILSNEKIQPWIRELVRFDMHVAGIHLGSMLMESLINHVVPEKKGVNVVSVCCDKGFIRHNFYIDGHLRFSRLSRSGEDADANEIYRVVRGEIEKTTQYLVSLKLIPNNSKVSAHVLVPDDLVEEMGALAAGSSEDRVTVRQVSSRVVGTAMGIKKPISEFGRDMSLMVHVMASSFAFVQLASLEQIRYYLFRLSTNVAIAAALFWGVFNSLGYGFDMFASFNRYSSENEELAIKIRETSGDYNSRVEDFVQPPSTTENMRASVNVLNHVTDIEVDPGRLLLFFSNQLSLANGLYVKDITWYVTNQKENLSPGELSYANGLDYYEVLEVDGQVDPESNPELSLSQFKQLIKDIDSRPDMNVLVTKSPQLVEAGGNIRGSIASDTNIKNTLNAFTNTEFAFSIVWDQDYNLEADSEQQKES